MKLKTPILTQAHVSRIGETLDRLDEVAEVTIKVTFKDDTSLTYNSQDKLGFFSY